MAIKIPLTKGLFAVVDVGDFHLIAQHAWYAMKGRKTFYAASNASIRGGKKKKTLLMHRIIIGCKSEVDHRDGNGLNNRRSNLRLASKSLNAVNSKRRNSTSRFRGVVWDGDRNKWAAYIKVDGKTKNLGRFKKESQAAKAYRNAAIPIYGEFVRLKQN